jgi:hypothetical protein
VAFIPQAKYTDWVTATCRRNLVPTSVDRGVSRGERGGSPTVVILSFLDRSRDFFFQVAHHLSSQGLIGPSSENRTRDLWVSNQELWPLDHRGGPMIVKGELNSTQIDVGFT